MATKEEQRKEAIERLKILVNGGLDKSVLDQFEEDGTLFYSERQRLNGAVLIGALYWASNDTAVSATGKSFAKAISDFEQSHDAVVYHATHETTEFGELLDLFYVSKYDEEWESDRELLGEGCTYASVVNFNDPLSGEIGCIGFDIKLGGIVRTY